MSYSICVNGGKLCDGCMDCYKDNPDDYLDYEDEIYVDENGRELCESCVGELEEVCDDD